MHNTLNVHSIETFGTHDGPGIRLVIFLQGCNIKCKYCQNPDTIEAKATTITPIEDIVKRAIRMKPYFGKEGGITVSGGEPMLQSKSLLTLFKTLEKEGIHTNIDTNGTIKTKEAIELITNIADLIMFDLKACTSKGFKNITGQDYLNTLLHNIQLRENSKKFYWLRYVLIPDYTDSDEDINYIIDTFKGMKYLKKLDILPYHKLGAHKWTELGFDYEFMHVKENTPEQLEGIKTKLSNYFDLV